MYHLSARTNVKFIRADTETLADRTLSEKSIKHCKSQCKINIFHIHTNKMQLASGEPPAFALYIHMHIYIYNIILHMQNYRYTNWIISDHRHTYIYIYCSLQRESLHSYELGCCTEIFHHRRQITEQVGMLGMLGIGNTLSRASSEATRF